MPENPYHSPKAESSEGATTPSSQQNEHNPLVDQIQRAANASVVFGIIGVLFLISAPIAITLGKNAILLISKHSVGAEFEPTARRGILLGWIGIGIMLVILLGCMTFAVVALLIFDRK